MTPRLLLCLTLATSLPAADIYYLLWFDTEDYVEPAADDAALRLAEELDKMGVKATFKVVGEKARVLESRKRFDVIRALAQHDIGYHAENHSIPPPPAMYLKPLGMLEGAEEFVRREGQGVADIRRIFGLTPSCYGQPGSSWGPQSTIALRRLGIPAYVDEGSQVGLNNQPFWYGGILHVFGLGPFNMRADLNDESKLGEAKKKFDDAVSRLRATGGVIHTYYHPTEFATTEFWDGVNFSHGRFTARSDYRMPNRRTPESMERAYRLLFDFVKHVKATPGIRIITARQLPQVVEPSQQPVNQTVARQQFQQSIDWNGPHSAADLLLSLLGMKPRYVDGPTQRTATQMTGSFIPRVLFERGRQDAIEFVERHRRLPSHVWFGSERLSLGDFAATLAHEDRTSANVTMHRGVLAFEKHIASDGKRSFNWAIHPEDFDGSELLELGRLQAWTLKPARLK